MYTYNFNKKIRILFYIMSVIQLKPILLNYCLVSKKVLLKKKHVHAYKCKPFKITT